MEFREALSARLPAKRDDEPRGLRQDIIDELADHLACSLHRELLRGTDPATARARALEHFGDPAAVAQGLWLDAMRGKIMLLRVLLGTCVLVTAVSLCMVGVLWQQAAYARRLARLEAAKAEAMAAEARAREAEVLKRLGEMSQAIQHPRSLDWNPVRIKLTEETADGPPVAEATVELTRPHQNPGNSICKFSDASGIVDFGLLQPGDYRLFASRSWADGTLYSSAELNVQPGSDVTTSIVCPKTPPLTTAVRVRWRWPADLEKESLCLYAPFDFYSRAIGQGTPWFIQRAKDVESKQKNTNEYNQNFFIAGHTPQHAVLCGPRSTTSELLDDKTPFFWTSDPDDSANRNAESPATASGAWATVPEKDIRDLPPDATIQIEAGKYVLWQLVVLRPTPAKDPAQRQRRYDVLVIARAPNAPRVRDQSGRPGNTVNPERFRVGAFEPQPLKPELELPEEYWLKLTQIFEARSGQPNEWTIPIPDELAQAVRDALKSAKVPKEQPAAKIEATKGNG